MMPYDTVMSIRGTNVPLLWVLCKLATTTLAKVAAVTRPWPMASLDMS